MDICALTDTLIVDQDGIYDPNAFNDRVLLGFKGTWSHTELHALRLRLQDAKLHKARKGELRCNPPTGYIYDAVGALVVDPDESVVAAVARLFQQFQELGSAFGVMRAWAAQGLPLSPAAVAAGCEWGPRLGPVELEPGLSHLAQSALYRDLCLWTPPEPARGGSGAGHPAADAPKAAARVDSRDS